MSDQSEVDAVVGSPMTPDEIKQLEALRNSLKPEASWERLDSYGKWIFSVAATVGVLGTGFSNSAFQVSSVYGKAAFSVAIAFLGLALAFAASGLTPRTMSASLSSIEAMRAAISGNICQRQKMLQWAGIFLGFAFALAAIAPMLSSAPSAKIVEKPRLLMTYSLAADGKLIVEAQGRGLKPLSIADLAFVARPRVGGLPRTRGVVSAEGKVDLKIELPNTRTLNSKLYAESEWVESLSLPQGEIGDIPRKKEIPLR